MEITNPTNQEVLVRASCFLQERQPSFSKEDCDWYVRQLSLYLNQWTMTDLLIHLNQPSKIGIWEQIEPLLIRLSNFEPLQYITKQAEFYGREFIVSPDTLIPRPETEELVEKIIAFLSEQSSGKVLEIGVGTGCIIHTLALECPDFFCCFFIKTTSSNSCCPYTNTTCFHWWQWIEWNSIFIHCNSYTI